ncbi:hypothetical protein BVY03_01020, partial [bacterium K02(2017)]
MTGCPEGQINVSGTCINRCGETENWNGTACLQCLPGQTYNQTSKICECESGQGVITDDNGNQSCSTCYAGQTINPKSNQCQCPDGENVFEDESGGKACFPCKTGQTYNAQNQTCECPEGQAILPGGNECTSCPEYIDNAPSVIKNGQCMSMEVACNSNANSPQEYGIIGEVYPPNACDDWCRGVSQTRNVYLTTQQTELGGPEYNDHKHHYTINVKFYRPTIGKCGECPSKYKQQPFGPQEKCPAGQIYEVDVADNIFESEDEIFCRKMDDDYWPYDQLSLQEYFRCDLNEGLKNINGSISCSKEEEEWDEATQSCKFKCGTAPEYFWDPDPG